MNRNRFGLLAVLGALTLMTSFGIAANEVALKGVKCLMVSSKDANPQKSATWKEGSVYFCCDNCLGKFNKLDDSGKEKVAAVANHQLVATKQYEQKGCPFSGGEINADTKIDVKGASVAFCCENCQGKAKNMKEDEQIASLFGEKAFKTAKFAPVKKD